MERGFSSNDRSQIAGNDWLNPTVAWHPLRQDSSHDTHAQVFSEDFLVFDLGTLDENQNFFQDIVPEWPVLNQQLATLMIVDDRSIPGQRLLRYPGALVTSNTTESGLTVAIPLFVKRDDDGVETLRWIPVIEEIASDRHPDPFQLSSLHRGIVALRINYPFQSASMSSFRPNPAGPFEPTIGFPNVADDGAVNDPDGPPGELVGGDLVDEQGLYAGTDDNSQ